MTRENQTVMNAARSRSFRALHRARREDMGELVTRQALPSERFDADPFLMLNHHGPQVYGPNNEGLPFGPHPHRGFETVTFIVDGSLVHRDTAGHESNIHAGGVQWMTAGSGIEHAELSPKEFLDSGGPLDILQLWINLPARLKMSEPRYTGLERDAIPSFTVDDDRVRVNLISGEWNGHRGPIGSLTGVQMSTIELKPGGRIELDAPRERSIFLYVVRGTIEIDGATIDPYQLVELGDESDQLMIEAKSDALILFGHGDPIREPVVSHGPFVMNTREEIIQAIRDYQNGKFKGKVAI